MSTAKFEKLIDLIINEDQERAEQLFHDIVVEKSRQIYESLIESDFDDMGDNIDTEEEGMFEEDDEFADDDFGGDDMGDDMGDDFGDEEDLGDVDVDGEMDLDSEDMDATGEEDLEDRVVDLEDKLDELMAEFESMMGDSGDDEGDEEDFGADDEGDDEDFGADDEGEEDDFGADDEGDEESVMEAIELKKVAGLYDSKISSDHTDGSKKGPVRANSGAKGMASSPVKFAGDSESVPTKPQGAAGKYAAKGETEVKDAGKWNNRPNANPSVAKTGKGDPVGRQYGDSKGKSQGSTVGAGGQKISQDNKSVIESRRTTKRKV